MQEEKGKYRIFNGSIPFTFSGTPEEFEKYIQKLAKENKEKGVEKEIEYQEIV